MIRVPDTPVRITVPSPVRNIRPSMLSVKLEVETETY